MNRSYAKLALALALSLGLMWTISMSMIRESSHFYYNLSNLWIALVMVGAMGVVMVLVMWAMFPSRTVNLALLVGFLALAGGAWALGRQEAFVGDEQFLKSMIPHHSRAILVCQESSLSDPEIVELCDGIVEAQKKEIDEMKAILERY
jgi:hypothetical protein